MLEDLRRTIAARPFVPFTIHTGAGDKVRVPTVDHIAIAPTDSRVVVFPDNDGTILVSALNISSIVVDPAPTSAD